MTEEMLGIVMEERDELLSVVRDYQRAIRERGTGCNHAGLIERLQAQLAVQAEVVDAARGLFTDEARYCENLAFADAYNRLLDALTRFDRKCIYDH